jgi:hypothetical protein
MTERKRGSTDKLGPGLRLPTRPWDGVPSGSCDATVTYNAFRDDFTKNIICLSLWAVEQV